jgi:photosystem II stability/assembly factor-like uncharacterized protein
MTVRVPSKRTVVGRRVLLAGALLCGAESTAQPEPGWGFAWERVGDRGIEAESVTFGIDGTLWAIRGDSLRWLDVSVGAGTWRAVAGDGGGFVVLPLQGDTLVVLNGNAIRSVDGGLFFETTALFGRNTLLEVPVGHAAAGRLLMGTLQNATGAAWSDDRGASWTQATVDSPHALHRLYSFADVPAADAPPGVTHRIVGGADGGVYLSDDAGTTWRPGPAPAFLYPDYRGDQVAAVPGPGGGTRLVLLVDVSGAPSIATFTSDDAGDSWAQGPWLAEPAGLGAPNAEALVEIGGGAALAVLGRGRIHRTDDAGLTWQEVAQAPRDNEFVHISGAALGPDGRLYVSAIDNSFERGWVYRTVDVVVAGEAPPDPVPGTIAIRPNPSLGGAASVTLALPESAHIRVALYDTLGRQVGVLHVGLLSAGEHTFPLPASLPAGVYVARGAGVSVTFTVQPAGR